MTQNPVLPIVTASLLPSNSVSANCKEVAMRLAATPNTAATCETIEGAFIARRKKPS
ncbi:hypothetical protein AB4Z46_34220 [Variovorax sp. M-6]|uniref:hypothetical protein n=1 Tax=Variovorax sp. M-6 TaxID=3233041 RepID=UPI003F986F40